MRTGNLEEERFDAMFQLLWHICLLWRKLSGLDEFVRNSVDGSRLGRSRWQLDRDL